MEAWGQGIERIQTYCADYGCPAPEWRYDGAGVWTVLYNKVNPNNVEKGVKKTTEKILSIIKINPQVTYKELAEALGLTEDGIYSSVKSLRSRGILRRIGGRKEGHWEIITKL